MSGLLSSFAISVAANIVTSLFSKNNTEKEIRTAFQDAIEKWCPNEDIRRFREREISKLLEDYMANPNMDPSNLPADMKEFLSVFEDSLKRVRILPNGRLNLDTVDELVRTNFSFLVSNPFDREYETKK